MIHEVFMPALSSTMTEGKIVSWEKSPGDKVEKGETVLVVESDKADMDVEAFYSGTLAAIIVEAGDVAPVGSTLALLAETEAEVEQAKQQAKNGGASEKSSSTPSPAPPPEAKAEPEPEPEPQPAASSSNGRTIVSPRARKLAKELKVDVKALKGSGPHGRIVGEDVEAAAGKQPAVATAAPAAKAPPAPAPSPAPKPSAPAAARGPSGAGLAQTNVPVGETVTMNTLQSAVAKNMMVSLSIPTYHVGYTITTDGFDAVYKKIKPKGVTVTGMLAKAVAVTLQKHPLLNANCVENKINYPPSINIAAAVAMPGGGLITPVLRDADKIDIYSLSRTWKDLVERARAKQLQPDEYSTGTFTISNLGMFGVDKFDAILPPNQGSILAIGASKPQLVVSDDGTFAVKRQMQVNITCDHRIIYGADAAAFLQDLAKLIENDPQSLTM
jgi:pyruvate dehydrogenase E2 component (dihydrolipoamide acetyltransferase)